MHHISQKQLVKLSKTPKLSGTILALVLVGIVAVGVYVVGTSHAAAQYYVATTGSDAASGSSAAPWKTITKALSSAHAGDTVIVRGGTYVENIQSPSLGVGTAAAPITMRASPGERPIIQGLFWVSGLTYWTFDGINITWNPNSGTADQHMVKITGGTGWRFTNAEIWGAHSWANVLITGDPDKWSIDHSRIHDNFGSPAHNGVQDHNFYVNTVLSSHTGTIDHNLIYNATRGEDIKFDGTGTGTGGGMQVAVTYNTLLNSSRSLLIGGQTRNITIHHNIIDTGQVGDRFTVYLYNNTGSGNTFHDNIVNNYAKFLNVAGSSSGLAVGTNFLGTLDPKLDANFRPAAAAATSYGSYAGGTSVPPSPQPTVAVTPVPTSPVTPVPSFTPVPTLPVTPRPTTTAPPTTTAADLNGDGRVNALDLSVLLTQYGSTTAGVRADINRDGRVNVLDMSLLLTAWTG